jgi:hypothetical protein
LRTGSTPGPILGKRIQYEADRGVGPLTFRNGTMNVPYKVQVKATHGNTHDLHDTEDLFK